LVRQHRLATVRAGFGKAEGELDHPGLWIPTTELARSPGHAFFERLNKILAESGFDGFVEELCAPFYAATNGRLTRYDPEPSRSCRRKPHARSRPRCAALAPSRCGPPPTRPRSSSC
jgi:hypothetical protein